MSLVLEDMFCVYPFCFFFFFFCFNHSILFKGTNSHAALATVKKPLNQQQVSSSDQGSKPETLRPSGMGQTARQLHKSKEIHWEKVTRKPLPTSRQRKDSSH